MKQVNVKVPDKTYWKLKKGALDNEESFQKYVSKKLEATA